MNVEKVGTYNTAGSAKLISEGQMGGFAAIASDLAAEAYGMEVLASNIEDDHMNFTRFLLLGRMVSYGGRGGEEEGRGNRRKGEGGRGCDGESPETAAAV